MPRALVTGATGFVGTHLVRALRETGVAVTALARSRSRAASLEREGVQVVLGTLNDPSVLHDACQGQQVVFHVAGVVSALDEQGYNAVNRDGTAALLEAATRAGVGRFVYLSSLAAAGPSAPGVPHREIRSAPVTAYGRSKLAGEEVVRGGSIPWTILRPPAVYGPGDAEFLKIFRLVRWGIAPVFGDGTQELSTVFAPDLAAALVAVPRREATIGGTYFVAHRDVVTSKGLVQAIGTAVGRRVRVLSIPRPLGVGILGVAGLASRLARRPSVLNPDKANEFFQPAWTCSPASFEQATGWRAETPLAEGLRTTAAWYRTRGWL